MNEAQQNLALKVFRNLCKNQKIILKLSQSDYLVKFFTKFIDKSATNREPLLAVLMEFASIDDNRKILCENGIVKEALEMLRQNGSSEACAAITTMSSNVFCLTEILSGQNIFSTLLSLATDENKEHSNRTLALTAFQKLTSIQGLNRLMEISDEMGEKFAKVLKTETNMSLTFLAISILTKLAGYYEIKSNLAATTLPNAVFTALTSSSRSTNLMIKLFNLTSHFMDQKSFRRAFADYGATDLIEFNMKSPSSLLQASVSHFIAVSADYPELCELLIPDGILTILMRNFDCPTSSFAFETILNHDLSVKFAVRGRLEACDKIKSGFYVTKGNWIEFQRLRDIMFSDNLSPLKTVYSINLEDAEMTLGQRSILHDKHLTDLISDVKNDPEFSSAEYHDKIKRLAVIVSKFHQTSDDCGLHQLKLHLTELKFKFASSVIPLGSLIHGRSFEVALLFKAVADQLEIDASLHADVAGKGWNRVCDDSNVIDLMFDVGEFYTASGFEARKYLQQIS